MLHSYSEKAKRTTWETTGSLSYIPEKIMEFVLLVSISGHMKEKKVTEEQSAWIYQG